MNVFETDPETLSRETLVSLVHDLRGRVENLSTQADEAFAQDMAKAFGLSRAQGRILSALLRRDRLTHVQVQNASCQHDLTNPPGLSTIKTQITHIRKKIAATGAHIINIWGYGYQITPSDKAKIKEWVKAHRGGDNG